MWMRQAVQARIERLARGESLSDRARMPATTPLRDTERSALAGSWWLDGGARLDLIDDGTTLWAAPVGQAATDLIAEAGPEARTAAAAAVRQTHRLLAGLQRGEAEASYREALREGGAPFIGEYLDEWRDVIAVNGELESFEMRGTTVRGPVTTTLARLRLARGTVDMQFNWTEMGAGRLSGTFVRPGYFQPGYPMASVIARQGADLIAHDIYTAASLPIVAERDAMGNIVRLLLGPERRVATRGHEPADLLPAVPGR
jgi:hypothetical protein